MHEVTVIRPIHEKSSIPFVESLLSAGFPSPADEYVEESLDLVDYLVDNPTATFYIRVKGLSMINAGIYPGDILAVDRSKEAKDGDIVVAAIDNEFTLKRKKGNQLIAENPEYPSISVRGDMECMIWGVASAVCRKLR